MRPMNHDVTIRKAGAEFVGAVKELCEQAKTVKMSEDGRAFWNDMKAACEREEARIVTRQRHEDAKKATTADKDAKEAVKQEDLKKKAEADAEAAKKAAAEGEGEKKAADEGEKDKD